MTHVRNQTTRRQAFTLVEMLVAVALLLILMGMAGTVFKISLEATGRLTQQSEIDRGIRALKNSLARELAAVDPRRSIMAIQGNAIETYWTAEQQAADNGDPADGLGNGASSFDPTRENPTLGSDPLDADSDGIFDSIPADDSVPQLPRADILMFVANMPGFKSNVNTDVTSDGPVMFVYNHAEQGTLDGSKSRVAVSQACQPGTDSTIPLCDNDSTEDWLVLPRPLEELAARDWYLVRRAVLLKNQPDPLEELPQGRDRFAHVLSPTNPAGNAEAGYLDQTGVPGIPQQYEVHYLNWILSGAMDVVSPVERINPNRTSARHKPPQIQDFVFEYEVARRYFGGPRPTGAPQPGDSLDWLVIDAGIPGVVGAGSAGYSRGPVPAFWMARSLIDPNPPVARAHRRPGFWVPNCASFKVEWTPNDVRIDQSGLPEIVWIDPYKPTDSTRFNQANLGPIGPAHLDEFNIIAQKVRTTSAAAGEELWDHPDFSAASKLLQAYNDLRPRFALNWDTGNRPDVVDLDPAMQGAQGNTHSWYARDLSVEDGLFRTTDLPGAQWPRALRITVDMYDDNGSFDRPVRHVFIMPVGPQGDLNQKIG